MIPFVKLYIRRFHITSNVFLRKACPKKLSDDQNHDIPENNSNSPSSFQSSCPDYLGIESEENVITVVPQKHRFQQSQTSDTRERFYRASFGIVRLDADNKLRRHGQYDKNVDFLFPHSSSKDKKVSNVSKTPIYKNPTYQDLSLKDSQNISALDALNIETSESSSLENKDCEKNYIDECYFGTTEMDNFPQNKIKSLEPEKLNFIDKNYFENLDQSKNSFFKQNSSKCADSSQEIDSAFCSKNQIEEINYLEKGYLENNPENLHIGKNSADSFNLNKFDSNLDCKNKLEELNYLEKDYFVTSNYSENVDVKKAFSNFSDIKNEVDSSSCTRDTLNKDYFGTLNNLESHLVKQNISNYTDNEEKMNSASLKSGFTHAVDELNYLDKRFFENSLSNDLNSIQYDELSKSSPHFKEDNNLINQDVYNQFNENNQNGETNIENKRNSEFSDNTVNELKEITLKQAYKFNSENLSVSKSQKNDRISHIKTETPTKKLNMPKELLNENVKSYSMENNFKFSEVVPEDSNQENQISTAHDFVEKMREEQKIRSQVISNGKVKDEEKFDSKGFRILKNQVPNLSYFTRDEILNLLKQNIVYSDDNLLVLNKPYNLVIHDSKTTKEPCLSTFLDDLAKEMDKQSINPKLITVHRLDKETTGCILLARNETMAMHLKALFAQRKIVKKYWVLTVGVPDPPEGVIDIPISEGSINNKTRMVLHPKLPSDILYKSHSKHGKPAVTTYKIISESGNAALVEAFPKTGVKHQIRVHFGFGLGCPILGDHKYSHLDKLVPQKLPTDMLQKLHVRQSKVRHIPMHIHAKSVGIPEYFDKRDLFVNIPIPQHFKINLKRLKFRKKDMTY